MVRARCVADAPVPLNDVATCSGASLRSLCRSQPDTPLLPGFRLPWDPETLEISSLGITYVFLSHLILAISPASCHPRIIHVFWVLRDSERGDLDSYIHPFS